MSALLLKRGNALYFLLKTVFSNNSPFFKVGRYGRNDVCFKVIAYC